MKFSLHEHLEKHPRLVIENPVFEFDQWSERYVLTRENNRVETRESYAGTYLVFGKFYVPESSTYNMTDRLVLGIYGKEDRNFLLSEFVTHDTMQGYFVYEIESSLPILTPLMKWNLGLELSVYPTNPLECFIIGMRARIQ